MLVLLSVSIALGIGYGFLFVITKTRTIFTQRPSTKTLFFAHILANLLRIALCLILLFYLLRKEIFPSILVISGVLIAFVATVILYTEHMMNND